MSLSKRSSSLATVRAPYAPVQRLVEVPIAFFEIMELATRGASREIVPLIKSIIQVTQIDPTGLRQLSEMPHSNGHRVISYDLETLKARRIRGEDPIPGIVYADCDQDQYWTAYNLVGISVLCAYDLAEDRYYKFSDVAPPHIRDFFDVRPLSEFQKLIDGATPVSFNGGDANRRGFDNEVLAANGILVPADQCYDVLVQSWLAQGLSLTTYDKATHSGGLGDYTSAPENLGIQKSMDGQAAPIAWQQGKYREVIEYCQLDCRLTAKLYELIQNRGWLWNPKTNRRVEFAR